MDATLNLACAGVDRHAAYDRSWVFSGTMRTMAWCDQILRKGDDRTADYAIIIVVERDVAVRACIICTAASFCDAAVMRLMCIHAVRGVIVPSCWSRGTAKIKPCIRAPGSAAAQDDRGRRLAQHAKSPCGCGSSGRNIVWGELTATHRDPGQQSGAAGSQKLVSGKALPAHSSSAVS